MFHLYQPDHIEWPVSVDLPAKGGTKKAYTFTAHFNVLCQHDCQALQDQHNQMLVTMRHRLEVLQGYGKEDASVIEELPFSYEDLADAVLCGWGAEVVDRDGEPIEFTSASKAQLYRIQGAAAATFQAWLDSLGRPSEKGAAKAGGFRSKNS
jgi:hypothetical protein